MIKLTNKFYGASLIALAFSLNVADVNAQTCTSAPSCDTLGFTKSETDCVGHAVLRCPFDTTKLFCDNVQSSCGVGDVVYSDRTCSVEPISGKKAIGVVFDADRRLAIGLGTAQMAWSSVAFDIPDLPNLSDASGDYSGKSNTTTVMTYCKNNSKTCPAFDSYISGYSTEGTSAGAWYIPALGELKAIYNNKAAINTTLEKISNATKLPDGYHLSSSEYSNYDAWTVEMSSGAAGGNSKTGPRFIRPVLAF